MGAFDDLPGAVHDNFADLPEAPAGIMEPTEQFALGPTMTGLLHGRGGSMGQAIKENLFPMYRGQQIMHGIGQLVAGAQNLATKATGGTPTWEAGKTIGPAVQPELTGDTMHDAVATFFADLFNQAKTPEGIGTLPFAGTKPVQALFAGQSPEVVSQGLSTAMNTNLPPTQRMVGGLQVGLGGLMSLGAGVKAPPAFADLKDIAGATPGPTAGDLHTMRTGQEPLPFDRQIGNQRQFVASPEGTVMDLNTMSPGEQTEFARLAQAEADTGPQRKANTVAAGLDQMPEGRPTVTDANGVKWNKQGDYWVADKPLNTMNALAQVKEGRSPMETQIAQNLERLWQDQQTVSGTPMADIINEVTGVSRPKGKVRGLPTQELPFNEVFQSLLAKDKVSDFYAGVGDQVYPVRDVQDAVGAAKAAKSRAGQSYPVEIYNKQGSHLGTIDTEGNFRVRQPGEAPPTINRPPSTDVPPEAPGPVGPKPVKPTPPQGPAPGLPEPETLKGGAKAQDYSPEDLQRYIELRKGTIPQTAAQISSPEFQENWKQFEALRNKYGGMPPKNLPVEAPKVPTVDLTAAVKRRNVEPSGKVYWHGKEVEPTNEHMAESLPELDQRIAEAKAKIAELKAAQAKKPSAKPDEVRSHLPADAAPWNWDQAIDSYKRSLADAEQYRADRLLANKAYNAKKGTEPYAVPELRPNKLPEAQPPGDLPKVEEKVRPGAEAKGPAQEAPKVEAPKPQDVVGIQHDLKAAASAIAFGRRKGYLTPEEAAAHQAKGNDIFTRMSKGEDVGTEAADLYNQVREQNAKAKPQPGLGVKAALEKNKGKGAEPGFVNVEGIKDVWNDLKSFKEKFLSSLNTTGVKGAVAAFKDRADNAADLLGDRSKNALNSLAKVGFGDDWRKAVNSIPAAIEAAGDRTKLDQFIAQSKGKDQRAYDAAVFAKAHWDDMKPLVDRAAQAHDLVYNESRKAGINIDRRDSYIRHLIDLSKLPNHVADKFFGGAVSGFKKGRVYDTLYDLVEAGHGKAIKTWNGADLVQSRVSDGMRQVNTLGWVEGFKKSFDPTTKLPIVKDLVERVLPNGSKEMSAPAGYKVFTPFPGHSFAVHRGYFNFFESLQAMSAIRKAEVFGLPVGQALMKTHGTVKHIAFGYDTYHAFRMAYKGASLGATNFKRGLALLDYSPGDLAAAVKAGDVRPEMAAWANKNRWIGNLGIKAGLNIGRIQEAIDADVIRKINPLGMGSANKWIFEKESRGIIQESFVNEFKRVKAANPKMADFDVARKVARDINFAFGNIGRQGFIKSATFQDIARLILWAPQWFESMAQTEARSIGQVGKQVVTGKQGTLARTTTNLLLAGFAATQIANIISKGQLTFQNEDGHQLDAWVPGIPGVGKKEGYYVSLFSLPMEVTHDIVRYSAQGKTPLETAGQILQNKLTPEMRAIDTLRSRKDYKGTPMSDADTYKTAAASLAPAPLPVQAAAKGDLQRQGTAMIGFKSEPAEGAVSKVIQLARKYKKSVGIPPDAGYPDSPYFPLVHALGNGDDEAAKKAYGELMKKLPLDKEENDKEKQVEKYFVGFADKAYTGNLEREQAFYDSLSPSDRAKYDQVKEQNHTIEERFFNLIMDKNPPVRKRRRPQVGG